MNILSSLSELNPGMILEYIDINGALMGDPFLLLKALDKNETGIRYESWHIMYIKDKSFGIKQLYEQNIGFMVVRAKS